MKTTIDTNRFHLRLIAPSDHQNVFLGLSDPAVIAHYGVSFMTLEATLEQMEWFADLEKNNTGRWWAICDKIDGTFLGAIGYNDMSSTHRKAEIGMWLLKKHWGNGTLKEVMPTVLDYGFQSLNLHRIEGFVDSDNSKCKQALDKIDFQYEGTMRDSEFKDGAFLSVDIYAKINR